MKTKKPKILVVEILEAKPNPLFTEPQRQCVRFLRYNQHIPCAECGKKRRVMWTMLYQFKCGDMKNSLFTLQFSTKSHAPLTPVCDDHPLAPDFPKAETKKSKKKKL